MSRSQNNMTGRIFPLSRNHSSNPMPTQHKVGYPGTKMNLSAILFYRFPDTDNHIRQFISPHMRMSIRQYSWIGSVKHQNLHDSPDIAAFFRTGI